MLLLGLTNAHFSRPLRRRARRATTLGLIWAALSGMGCTVEDVEGDLVEQDDIEFRELVLVTPPDVQKIPAPLPAAHCSIKVVGQKTYDIESNYLPRTVWCENGGADFEALKAQAIAARSVVYYEASLDGSICDSEACQHASCIENSADATLAKVPEEVFRAVKETSGMYLKYEDTLTYAFYVAGSKTFNGDTCIGKAGGAATEKWVTYNNGKDKTAVEQTKLGSVFVPSDNEYGQNRGCMSQWGARCLEKDGADALDILQFYYGEDIEVAKAEGECVGDSTSLGDPDECGDDKCTGSENEDNCSKDCKPCGSVDNRDPTIIEESSTCFSHTGDDQYVRREAGKGHGDSLLWTESTENEAHTNGNWSMNFKRAGTYRVEVFIEGDFAQEDRARYRLTHKGKETNLRVDQVRAKGWVDLGLFEFEEGHKDQGLKLTDLSGDRGNTIVFDAVRVTPAAEGEKADDVNGVGGDRGGDGQGCSVGTRGSTGPVTAAVVMLAMGAGRRRRRN